MVGILLRLSLNAPPPPLTTALSRRASKAPVNGLEEKTSPEFKMSKIQGNRALSNLSLSTVLNRVRSSFLTLNH